MAPGLRAALGRLGLVIVAAAAAGPSLDAQESGAQPLAARSIWSRILGARQYEYDERIDLSLDGSAVVDVNASVPALVALHGATLDTDPEAQLDRQAIRSLFNGAGASVRNVSVYRRHGRRFVHVRLEAGDIRNVSTVVPLSWSRYRLDRDGGEYHYVQDVGPPAGSQVGDVGWTGQELVAFRLHLPSKIDFHNSPDDIERGNTLAWEQPLQARLSGAPLHMEARMETESILYRTLWLFGGTFLAAMALLAGIIWWVARRGKGRSRIAA